MMSASLGIHLHGAQAWPPPDALAPPWDRDSRDRLRFTTAGAHIPRTADPETRRAAAEEDLDILRLASPPDLSVWTDGAARDGHRDGVGGVFIELDRGRPPLSSTVPAGAHCSSTAAEATAADEGLRLAGQELDHRPDPTSTIIWLLFDSRALHDALQAPWSRLRDPVTLSVANRALAIATRCKELHIIWIPSHSGIAGNEAADVAAAAGDGLDQQPIPITHGALASLLNRQLDSAWKARYEAATNPALPDTVAHFHRRASSNGEPPPWEGLTRAQASTLTQLRLDRAPYLEATRHRWGQSESPDCPCGEGPEDAAHFLLHCPRWDNERRTTIGSAAQPDCLQNEPRNVLSFLNRCARP
jgi:ribonuclease HI